MIRLTLLLLAGIGATMSIAGRPVEDNGVEVTRTAGLDDQGLLDSMNIAATPGTAAAADQPQRLALSDERGAIARALAATVAPEPAPASQTDLEEQAEEIAAADRTTSDIATGNAAADLWVVTGSRVNLRSGPSTRNAVVGQVVEGDRA